VYSAAMSPTEPLEHPLERAEELLAITPKSEDVFEATLEGFGGITLGVATHAAARTCPERALGSIHTHFLRAVPPEACVELRVERMRDGRRLAHRRVQGWHGDRLFLDLMAVFANPGDGPAYQDVDGGATDALARPEELPTEAFHAHAEGWEAYGHGPLEWRWIGRPWERAANEGSAYQAWVRPRVPLPADPAVQAATLAYLSDYHSHWSVARMTNLDFSTEGFVSLDTALWVHRDLPWKEWRLITTRSDVAHGGRALTRRALQEADGRLVASMAQEALIPPAP